MSGWAYGFDSRQPHHVGTMILIQRYRDYRPSFLLKTAERGSFSYILNASTAIDRGSSRSVEVLFGSSLAFWPLYALKFWKRR